MKSRKQADKIVDRKDNIDQRLSSRRVRHMAEIFFYVACIPNPSNAKQYFTHKIAIKIEQKQRI